MDFGEEGKISGEYLEMACQNSTIVGENAREIHESVLAEENMVHTDALVEESIAMQEKPTSHQRNALGASLNAIPTNPTAIVMSLSEADALNSNDGSIGINEDGVNFEAQPVSTNGTEDSLLEGFMNQKDELSEENIESTVLNTREDVDNDTALDTESIDDRGVLAEPSTLTQQDLGDELPPWAARLKGCERIGDSYRGYVYTEAELDILLSMHKDHTHSSWGTRQSPSSQKPSVRFMWKSQYVPYDGVPFLNSGKLYNAHIPESTQVGLSCKISTIFHPRNRLSFYSTQHCQQSIAVSSINTGLQEVYY